MEKYRKKNVVISLIVIILFITIQAIMHFKRFDSDKAYFGSSISPGDYTKLFNQKAQKCLKLDIAFNSKVKNSIAFYKFIDNNEPDYQSVIFIYKINVVDSIPIDKLIGDGDKQETVDVFSPTYAEHYFNKKMGDLNFYNSYYSFPKTTNILLNFTGDSLSKEVLSNNLISYNIVLKDFILKYEQKGLTDIEIKKTVFATNAKTNIVFLKKNGALYLLSMSSYGNNSISNNQILSILDTNAYY